MHSRAVEEVGCSLTDGADESAEMEGEEAVDSAGSGDSATDGGSRAMRSVDEATAETMHALATLGAEALAGAARFFFAMSASDREPRGLRVNRSDSHDAGRPRPRPIFQLPRAPNMSPDRMIVANAFRDTHNSFCGKGIGAGSSGFRSGLATRTLYSNYHNIEKID